MIGKENGMFRAGYSMVRAFLRKLREDTVSAFAAQTAFFVILSFLPFLIFLLTLFRFLPVRTEGILSAIHSVFPPVVGDFVGMLLREVREKTSGALLSISVIAALWSASRGFLAIIQGMNAVYGNKETRNYFVLRLWSVGYTLVFAVVLLLTLVLLVFGNQIYMKIQSIFPLLEHVALLVISLRTIVSFLFLVGFFFAIYLFVPNRKCIAYAPELPGALLTAIGWMGFSYLYSFYIDHMAGVSAMYGSLTAVALCMIWVYACMYIMFIGAELNVVAADESVRQAWREFKGSFNRTEKRNNFTK